MPVRVTFTSPCPLSRRSDAFRYCDVQIVGGNFSNCHATDNGGFLYARDEAVVTVKGGYISNNKAEARGGAVGRSCVVFETQSVLC